MRLKTSVEIFNYWDDLRKDGDAPLQRLIKLATISCSVSRLFLLEEVDSRLYFRLAGTRVCEVFERELRGGLFSSIWDKEIAKESETLARNVIKDVEPLVIYSTAQTMCDRLIEVEVVLMPLCSKDIDCDRILGCFSIDGRKSRFIEAPIVGLTIKNYRVPTRDMIEDVSVLNEAFDLYVLSLTKEPRLNCYQQKILNLKIYNGKKNSADVEFGTSICNGITY